MKPFIPILISGTLLASLLLAGCSSNSESGGTATDTQAGTGSSAQQSQGNGDENRQNGVRNMSMNFGKIKSITGNTITIYKSDMSMPGQGGGQEGTPPERPEGDQASVNGATSEGGQPPGDAPAGGAPQGEAPSGEMPSGEMPSGEMPEGGRQGSGLGGRMQQSFSEETTEIPIDVDTKIVTTTFDNGTRKENVITIAELKADDIIQYTLKSDTNVAESISLSSGNPGGAAPYKSEGSGS